jgi:hypothetical protein
MRRPEIERGPARYPLADLERPRGGAQSDENAVDVVDQHVFERCQGPEAARRVARARSVHLDQHQRERLAEVEAVALGLVRQQRRLVLPRRDERAQERRCAPALRRLHALLREQDDADDARASLEDPDRDVVELAAMKEGHRPEDVVAADDRHDAARFPLGDAPRAPSAHLSARGQRARHLGAAHGRRRGGVAAAVA